MSRRHILSLAICVSVAAAVGSPVAAQRSGQIVPGANQSRDPIPTTPRLLPNCPVRLGGVFTSGLSDGGASGQPAGDEGKLSLANRKWITENLDAVALSPSDIDPDTFPAINKVQKLFTPLLYLYATSLYETPHRGSIAVWTPEMAKWSLLRRDGSPVPFPEPGGHWIDFANTEWASFWVGRLNELTVKYGAYGAAIAELPLGNTFVGSDLQNYGPPRDRAEATKTWLTVVRSRYRNLLIPSALGFDLAAGHNTPDPQTPFAAPALAPRLWNDFFHLTDGAWCEGWVQPYWDRLPLSESLWETQMQAADRAGRLGNVFIAGAAYRNDRELEFALASYLLIVHNQGRAVFQPMPIRPGERTDSGFSLSVMKREVREKPSFFRLPLGRGMQERHQLPADGGPVWRRSFQFGDVYVNSAENKTVSVQFAGNMRRVTGELIRRIVLPPHSGAILLYGSDSSSKKESHSGRSIVPAKRQSSRRSK